MKDTLIKDLKQSLQGEVRFSEVDRLLYSTDASIYQIKPLGVVIPSGLEDVMTTVNLTKAMNVSLLPRGGGTSLAGQTVGEGVIIDFSKYMNRILEVNQEEGWAWVEPGLVADCLNRYLTPYHLQFAPETATSNRATLGGMCGNNSAGARSIIYGKMIDHVMACQVVLSDDSVATFSGLSDEEIQVKRQGNRLEAQLYRHIPDIIAQNESEILARYPKLLRRVSGYNLDALLPNFPQVSPLPDTDPRFNLAKLLVGSEGTLGIVTALKVRLIGKPERKALGIVHFSTLKQAVEAVHSIVELHPSAVELVDELILQAARQSRELQRQIGWLEGNPAAILIVEFRGESESEMVDRLTRLQQLNLGYHVTSILKPTHQSQVWTVRKAGLGMLMSVRTPRKPLAFVEDPAVSLVHLPNFVAEFQKILAKYKTTAGYYGHASVGCLHIRPALNLKEQKDIAIMKSMLGEISDLALALGGSMSGEHGDGLTRGWLNQKMYGAQLYRAFQEIKRAFDPDNRLNPRKIVDCPPPEQNLRPHVTLKIPQLTTHLDFSRELGLTNSVEMCNGNGACRKLDLGTMCPSYQATKDEKHCTRGRANVWRNVLFESGDTVNLNHPQLSEVMDLCLQCKACQTECPSSINMAKLKTEFLSHYHAQQGTSLRDRLVSRIHLINRIGSLTAPLSNGLMASVVGRVGKQLLGIAPQRQLPVFSRQRFSQWFRQHTPLSEGKRGKIVLFKDTYLEYNQPHIGQAATRLLEALGYEVILVQQGCCGRPAISKGLLEEARKLARYNVEQLLPYAREGILIVGCEPSCLLTLTDEYLDLVNAQAAEEVAKQVRTIDHFLAQLQQQGNLTLKFKTRSSPVLVHGHCHQKALVGMNPTLDVLSLAYPTQAIDSGCCGMAGAFGYEQEHYELSLEIGSQRLFPAIQGSPQETLLVANGISCRQQIAHGTGRIARHFVEVMDEALEF